jgi:hypothetical protein
MSVVYFAHSYRERDARVVDFFARLIRSEGLTVSLDPPSDSVNSAKLQRHLNSSDGMIAVLSRRDDSTSPHILYEINLAVKTGVPLLVFVEDTIPTATVSARLAQQRFSARWFLREVREHRHVLKGFKSFIHDFEPPKFRPPTSKRACVLVGLENLRHENIEEVSSWIRTEADYDTFALEHDVDPHESYELLRNANVAVTVRGTKPSYADGLLAGIAIPTIAFSVITPAPRPWPPQEYWPRPISPQHPLQRALRTEFQLFEEDFLDLTDQEAVDRYALTLIELQGRYDEKTRSHVIQEVVMGDKYVASGQAIQGPHAHVHDVNFKQVWNAFSGGSTTTDDIATLAEQLERLRQHLRVQASTREEDSAVAEIAAAATAADDGDGPTVMAHLAKVGSWALSAATAIGTAVAAAAIKAATGL